MKDLRQQGWLRLVRGVCCVFLGGWACGEKEEEVEPELTIRADAGGAATAVAGKVFQAKVVTSAATPLSGLIIWLYDQTDFTVRIAKTNAEGSFSFPLSAFVVEHAYSLHLLTALDVYIGTVDFDTASGVQNVFTYDGTAVGIDLDTLSVETDVFGEINFAATLLSGELSPGFSALSSGVEINSVSLPSTLNSVVFSKSLYLVDPQEILTAYYRKSSNMNFYQELLQRDTRLFFRVQAASAQALRFVTATANIGWMNGLTYVPGPTASLAESSQWSFVGYKVGKVDDAVFAANLLVRNSISSRQAVILRVQLANGVLYNIPRLLTGGIAMPPMVSAIGLNDVVTSVDFDSSTAANGLSLAFEVGTSDVNLTMVPPKDANNNLLLSSSMGIVEVYFQYYQSILGVLTEWEPKPTDFSGSLSASTNLAPLSFASKVWDPSLRRLTFTLDQTTAASLTTHALTLERGLFLLSNHASNIKTRISIVYKGASQESSTIVWFK